MTHTMTTQPEVWQVIVGVDTHKHVHVAVAIDTRGIRLGDHSFVADSSGYQALLRWAHTHGRIETFGIEGTGSYGAGLARAVRRAGHRVTDVNRGDRRLRRAVGKSDTIDAEAAARSVLAGQSTAIPKTARRRRARASAMGCEIGRIRPTKVFERAGESRMTPPASSISSQVPNRRIIGPLLVGMHCSV